MQQILALRKTLAELNLRRQQAEARRREEITVAASAIWRRR
jgi:hypothetical protein